mmetsp:Transcript_18258/g.18327  ORF Transcript_18258/g.18327 Transcript_18258/m.18327 type:complete len:318 (-) Transcript_18258:168-1121(-)
MTVIFFLELLVLILGTKASFISIRGHSPVHKLPFNMASSWPVWTFENGAINRVEDHMDEEGWVNPSSFEKVFCPSDLPLPRAQPGLGVVVASGTPRYIMPSIILTLETADKSWRNRGVCSVPRARAWIYLFAMFAPSLKNLRIHGYGQSLPELRFLEDQDGSGIWDNLISVSSDDAGMKAMKQTQRQRQTDSGLFRPDMIVADLGIEVEETFKSFQSFLSSAREAQQLSVGYQYVDLVLPVPSALKMGLPKDRIKLYLTDFDEPKRLINYEDVEDLDLEPLGELDVSVSIIGAGGSSEFLPEVYRSLFEPGSILFDS